MYGNAEVLLGPRGQRCQRGRWRSHPLPATRQPVGFSIGPQRCRQHHRAFLEFPAYPQTHLSRSGNGSPTPSASPQIRKLNFSTHHLANSVADIREFALRDFPRPMPHDTASRSHKPLWQKVTLPGQPASEEIRLVKTNEMPVSERFACDLAKKHISSIQGCQNKCGPDFLAGQIHERKWDDHHIACYKSFHTPSSSGEDQSSAQAAWAKGKKEAPTASSPPGSRAPTAARSTSASQANPTTSKNASTKCSASTGKPSSRQEKKIEIPA